MERTRLEMLQSFAEKKPNDPFSWYGLAMEYAKLDQLDKAEETFRRVEELDPYYSASYFHHGQVLVKQGKIEQAKQVYRSGIAASQKKGDFHTLGELQEALNQLGSEGQGARDDRRGSTDEYEE